MCHVSFNRGCMEYKIALNLVIPFSINIFYVDSFELKPQCIIMVDVQHGNYRFQCCYITIELFRLCPEWKIASTLISEIEWEMMMYHYFSFSYTIVFHSLHQHETNAYTHTHPSTMSRFKCIICFDSNAFHVVHTDNNTTDTLTHTHIPE